MRDTFLPYALPFIGQEEIDEVTDSLRSGWITTGPKVKRFEEAFASYCGAAHAVAVNSCTAGLHLSLAALGITNGDEVVVPTLTFCATANVVVHLGARPVLVDVDAHGQISVAAVERALSARTRAIVPVHYGGQACDLDELLQLAAGHGLPVVEDAAHAAGTQYRGRRIGTHGSATVFSFYATKNMTTGEGGMVTTNDAELASRVRRLALHGMSRDAWKRYTEAGSWYYEILEAGYKANMTDLQASIGIHQLNRLDSFIDRRREIATRYREAFRDLEAIGLPQERADRNHTYHLYPIQLKPGHLALTRAQFIEELKLRNIGCSVHFIPLHRHPFFQNTFYYGLQEFPVAEQIYSGTVSLPLYPKMSGTDVSDVIDAVRTVVQQNTRAVAA